MAVSLQGEYVYNETYGKMEVIEMSFTSIYVKIPQILPEDQKLEVRFHLGKDDLLAWSKAIVSKNIDSLLVLELIETPPQTVKAISAFINNLANQSVKRILHNQSD